MSGRTAKDFERSKARAAKPEPPAQSLDEIAKSHRAWQRFKPSPASELGQMLHTWASRVAAIAPTAARIERLSADVRRLESERAAVTWESLPVALADLDVALWSSREILKLAQAEYQRRDGWAISTGFDLNQLWPRGCALLCQIDDLGNEDVRSLLSPTERKLAVTKARGELGALIGSERAKAETVTPFDRETVRGQILK